MEVPASCSPLSELSPPASLDVWADDLIGRRFEQVVQAFPENVACCGQDETVTFSKLNCSADVVARFLCRTRGECEEPIAVLTEHGPPFLRAILGVLKAGKTCTPLDPSWPVTRLAGMLQDSGAGLLLTNAQNRELALTLASASRDIAMLESMRVEGHFADPPQDFSPDRPAYLLYTSGSTGQPKGIVHSHRTALHNIGIYTHVWEIDSLEIPDYGGRWRLMLGHYQKIVRNASIVPLGRRIGLAGSRAYMSKDFSCWRRIETGGVDHCILPIDAGHLKCFQGDSGIHWAEFLESAYQRLTAS
jgi:acyl-CoA synthetase (AMP-forming)/AMP-acid ligase II